MSSAVAPDRAVAPPGRSTEPLICTQATADQALDEAVARIADLATRLWAVRRTHRAAPARRLPGLGAGLAGLRRPGARPRCEGCGRPFPCPTLRATGPR